ncbi:unnamed protein product [Merluccius merluccius]
MAMFLTMVGKSLDVTGYTTQNKVIWNFPIISRKMDTPGKSALLAAASPRQLLTSAQLAVSSPELSWNHRGN